MEPPRILFGVGATKAGTSWLHEWLSGHPECHLRSVKELHYFDTLEGRGVSARITALEAQRQRLAEQGASPARLDDLADCISMFRRSDDPSAYLAYLTQGRGERAVVGDVTPAYGLLPVARLKAMATLGETRFLYILRDPVARLWSHVRMIARRREPDGTVTPERAGRVLQRTIRGDEDHIAVRGDYRGAMERISVVVPEAQRLFVFFEDLVSGDAARRVCEFLGIAPMPVLNAVVHAGQPLPITPEQAARARDFLDDQYRYVEQAMGRLPEAWRRHERV